MLHDTTDYLWYITNITTTSSSNTILISSLGDMATLYVDNNIISTALTASNVTFKFTTSPGVHKLQFLSRTIGLINFGMSLEQWSRGIFTPITLNGQDISNHTWVHQVGVLGEYLQLYTSEGASKVSWNNNNSGINKPITWYKTSFDLPTNFNAQTPLVLDLAGLGKGYTFINGNNIGRYYLITGNGDCGNCSYIGSYNPYGGCQINCGEPSQRYYHVPWSYLQQTNNLLVLFEENGGDPTNISLLQSTQI